MTIEAIAWKNLVNEQHTYVMQFLTGSTKEAKNIQETLKDWKAVGTGMKNGAEVLIFKKDFKDTLAWTEWAKNAPFIINEVDKVGEPKRLKTTVVLPDDNKRKCRLCNRSGHNAATCSENPKNKGKVEKITVQGKKICGHCGGVGHNKRTCLSYKRSLEAFKDS